METKNIERFTDKPADTTIYYDKDSLVKSVYFSKVKTDSIVSKYTPAISFTSPAYADCISPGSISWQQFSDIQLISNSAVSVNSAINISPGDTLNIFFEAAVFRGDFGIYEQTNFSPMPNFLSSYQIDHSLDEFWFHFKEIPDHPITLTFNIQIKLSDNTTFILENEKMKIK